MMNSNLPSVVLVGGGGHCRSMIDVIEAEGALRIAGIVDLPERSEATVCDYRWIGSDADLPLLMQKYSCFLVATGQVGLPVIRERLFGAIVAGGGQLPTVCSPSAWVSPRATLGCGTVVFHQAVVNTGGTVGCNVTINTAALIEHDVQVGDHCHISTGARINGDCVVEKRCFVGSGAVLREGVRLAEGTVIGAGAVVVRDTEPYGIYVGIPARRLKDNPWPMA